jgi:hypothetical protein
MTTRKTTTKHATRRPAKRPVAALVTVTPVLQDARVLTGNDPAPGFGALGAAVSAAQADIRTDYVTKSELVAAVRAHAVTHYDEGWDFVVESWSDEKIMEVIQWASYARGAINLMGTKVKRHNVVRQDVQAAQ